MIRLYSAKKILSNQIKRVIIIFMKKELKTNKIIIAVLCAVLLICGGVFGFQAAKSGSFSKKAEKASVSVSESESGQTGGAISAGGSFDSDESEAKSQSSQSGKNQSTKSKTTSTTARAETKATEKSADSADSAEKKDNKEHAEAPQKREITVSFSITCKNAVDYGRSDIPQSGYFIRPEDYSGKEGITVFDVLEAECKSRGIELTYKDKYYIQGIGGLKEKECGGGSGWMYRVNGVAPHKAAVGYYLKDGDVVEWYYVTNINDN